MRKLLIGAAVVAVVAIPTVALAQNPAPVVSGESKLTPSKAGTTKKPKAAKFSFKVVNSPESKTTVKQIVLDLPKGVKLDGSKLDTCTAAEVVANGPDKCPSGSKLGTGVSYAFIVSTLAAPDCVGTGGSASGCLTFDATFFVGGPKALTVALFERSTSTSFSPLTGKITNSGRKLTINIPPELQNTAAGYSALSQLSGSFSRSKTVKGKKYSFVSTTSCPSSKKWSIKSTLVYAPNPTAPPVGSKSTTNNAKCSK